MNPIIKLLNNRSDCFDLIEYPDGQRNIKLHLDKFNNKYPVVINCRIRDFSELEVLCCLVAALKRNNLYVSAIYFVYLFGVRSDRVFNRGEASYCEDILKPILESLYCKLYLYWPFIPLPLRFEYLPMEIYKGHWYPDFDTMRNCYVIGGDESASCIDAPFVNNWFDKVRNPDGSISVSLCLDVKNSLREFLIVDDLCDGGATFIAEAKFLKKEYAYSGLKLLVYHGLFTKGFDELLEYFDEIITTNSYQTICHPKVKQIEVW